MEKLRKCLYLEQDLFKSLKKITKIENVKENRIYEEFLKFALESYNLTQKNHLQLSEMDKYFRKGVEIYVNFEAGSSVNITSDDNTVAVKS